MAARYRQVRPHAVAWVLVLALVAVGCGDTGWYTAPPPPTPQASTTTTTDPTPGDVTAIEAMWRAQTDAWKTSVDEGITATVDTAWPVGGWTAEKIFCPPPGTTFDEMVSVWRVNGVERVSVPDPASVAPSPGWVVPADGRPGGGQVAPGRLYVMQVTHEVAGVPSTVEEHAVVGPDGAVRWFPVLCASLAG